MNKLKVKKITKFQRFGKLMNMIFIRVNYNNMIEIKLYTHLKLLILLKNEDFVVKTEIGFQHESLMTLNVTATTTLRTPCI